MIWYPYEQMKTMKEPYRILDAEGVHLYTKDQKLIDSISSWWCMIHGYKHPELTAAIQLVQRHYAAKLSAGRRDQVAAALARRGFSHAVIRQALETDQT